jgi:tripartite-type tricarboxylate transporter receptor subunit TctC
MRRLLAVLALLFSSAVLGQAYPSKPVRAIVAFPPGGPTDVSLRLIAPKMGEALGQQIVVENRAGASGNLATGQVAKSPADGYTLLVHSSAWAVNPSLFDNAGYDGERDFVAIAIVSAQPNLILVNSEFPAKSLAELLQMARTQKLAYASPSSGTTPHLTAENLFRVHARVDITHVPFKGGGPATAALLGGQPPIAALAIGGMMPNIRAGKLRVLAVSSARRLASMPDVPTLNELGYPGMEDYTWTGIFAPAGTPPEVAHKLNAAVLEAVRSPEVKQRLEELGFEITAAPLQQTAAYVKSELGKWAKVVRETGARVE